MQDEYLIEQYKKLYSQNRRYGRSGVRYLDVILPWIKHLEPESILDYGCGYSELLDRIKSRYKVSIFKYDPAISKYSKMPSEHVDMVICTDVLEHLYRNDIYKTISFIKKISECAIFSISCRLAYIKLPDGTNCHKTVKPKSWWMNRLKKYYNKITVISENMMENDITVVCENKTGPTSV